MITAPAPENIVVYITLTCSACGISEIATMRKQQ